MRRKEVINILQSDIDQYNLLKLKPVLSTRETAVVNMYDEAIVAENAGVEPAITDTAAALVKAQGDLEASEAGVSEAENAATETPLSDAEVVVPAESVKLAADLKVKQDALAAVQVANPQDPAAIADAQFAVDEAVKAVAKAPVVEPTLEQVVPFEPEPLVVEPFEPTPEVVEPVKPELTPVEAV